MPAAAVILWGLLNVFGIGSYIASLIGLFWWLLGEIFIIFFPYICLEAMKLMMVITDRNMQLS